MDNQFLPHSLLTDYLCTLGLIHVSKMVRKSKIHIYMYMHRSWHCGCLCYSVCWHQSVCRHVIGNTNGLCIGCPVMYGHYCLLQWRHNGRNGVSNHQHHDYLLNRVFRRKSKKTSKLRVTGLCVGNSPVTGEFPAQMACNADYVSIWWRHHVVKLTIWAVRCITFQYPAFWRYRYIWLKVITTVISFWNAWPHYVYMYRNMHIYSNMWALTEHSSFQIWWFDD